LRFVRRTHSGRGQNLSLLPECAASLEATEASRTVDWVCFFFLMGLVLLSFLYVIIMPGRNFELFQNQFTVIDPEMSFDVTTNGNYISTIGQIRNGSPYAWKDVYVEVQYFNKEGKMIDTCTREDYGEIIFAGDTQAFKVRGPADKPESEYSTQKVFIRSAKDSRKWP